MPPKRAATRKRQAKLSFSPVPASSARAADLSPQVRGRAAAITLDMSSSRAAKKRKVVELSDDSDTGLPTPIKSFRSNDHTTSRREMERGMQLGMPASTQRRGMFGSSDHEQRSPSSTSEAESEEEAVNLKPRKIRTASSRNDQKPMPENEDSESEHMPDTPPAPRRGRRLNRRQRAASFEVPDDEVEREESEDEAMMIETDSEVDRSDDEVKSSGRRLLHKKASEKDRQEQEDLQEDLEFLKSSPPATTRRNESKPMNKKQKALAALKRCRASAAGEPSSSATPRRKRAVVLSESEEEQESDLEIVPEEGESQDDEEDEEEQGYIHPTNVFQENADDGDFIDDDFDAPLGEPVNAHIPLKFTSWSSKKPRELFKFAVEWMVQKKINPGFSSSDEIYEVTFRKLDDEVSGLANSKYSSSIWTADFNRAYKERPEILIDEIGAKMREITSPHCEACNRSKHPATYNITFTGKPYNRETLEPLVDDSDSSNSDSGSNLSSSEDGDDSDPNGEKPTYDAQGEIIPPESRVFTVGSTCQANVQMAHTLRHWRHHLNNWVIDYLVREGYCTAEKLVQRDKWSERKRRKYANKIVDEMEEVGEIRKLHSLYKEQVDFALEARTEFRQGWGRR